MIDKNEIQIVGGCDFINGSIKKDLNSLRIEKLISDHLLFIGNDASGWCQLYRDPNDQRLWELTYPNSDLQRGGSPMLKSINPEDVAQKFPNHFSFL